MVCLRNICVNTLHKGDSIFTYNNNNNNNNNKHIYWYTHYWKHRTTDKPQKCSRYTSVDVHLLDSSCIFTLTIFWLAVFRVTTPCSVVGWNGRFGSTSGPHFQVWTNQFHGNTVVKSTFGSESQHGWRTDIQTDRSVVDPPSGHMKREQQNVPCQNFLDGCGLLQDNVNTSMQNTYLLNTYIWPTSVSALYRYALSTLAFAIMAA
jgi:hypothetical protein